jgi:hypothetical protein
MVLAQVAVAFSLLMTVMAVAVDLGLLLIERRHAQATADAAALAAASDIYAHNGSTGTASASALGVASANGYTNDSRTSTVTVNIPPLAGNFIGQAGHVEVVVTWYQKRGFSAILGSGDLPISARAVARGVSAPGAARVPAILLLGNTGTTLSGVGNGAISVTNSGGSPGIGSSIYVDSTGPNAVSMRGNGSTTAPSVYVAQTGAAPSGVSASPGTVNMGAPQLPNPMSYLPAPDINNPPPGINVMALPPITNNTVLASNTIYIAPAGGLSLTGNQGITGTNVMIYVPSGSITMTGNGAVNLSPMTSGPYQGITLFQDPSNSSGDKLAGNGNLNLTGMIYAPSANLEDTGNGTSDVFGSQVVANSMTMKGNGTVNVKFDANAPSTPPLRDFGLVE